MTDFEQTINDNIAAYKEEIRRAEMVKSVLSKLVIGQNADFKVIARGTHISGYNWQMYINVGPTEHEFVSIYENWARIDGVILCNENSVKIIPQHIACEPKVADERRSAPWRGMNNAKQKIDGYLLQPAVDYMRAFVDVDQDKVIELMSEFMAIRGRDQIVDYLKSFVKRNEHLDIMKEAKPRKSSAK